MLKLKEHSHRQPFGGHHYTEAGITFRADTFSGVVEKVRNFRFSNHMKVGMPDQDVLKFYAQNWPWLVDGSTEEAPVQEPEFTAWREWVQKMWAAGAQKTCSEKESRERMAICLNCPYNHPKNWAKEPEAASTNTQQFMLRRGYAELPGIGYCALHRVDIQVFSLLDTPAEFSSKKEGENKACWVGSLAGRNVRG